MNESHGTNGMQRLRRRGVWTLPASLNKLNDATPGEEALGWAVGWLGGVRAASSQENRVPHSLVASVNYVSRVDEFRPLQ
jgi:hypothetical protein